MQIEAERYFLHSSSYIIIDTLCITICSTYYVYNMIPTAIHLITESVKSIKVCLEFLSVRCLYVTSPFHLQCSCHLISLLLLPFLSKTFILLASLLSSLFVLLRPYKCHNSQTHATSQLVRW